MVHNLVYGQSGLGRFGRPAPTVAFDDTDPVLKTLAPAASVPKPIIDENANPTPTKASPITIVSTPTTTPTSPGIVKSNTTSAPVVSAAQNDLVSNFTSDAQTSNPMVTKKKILIIGGVVLALGITAVVIFSSSSK